MLFRVSLTDPGKLMMKHSPRESPFPAGTWAIFLGTALSLGWGGVACKVRSDTDPGPSRLGSVSEQAAPAAPAAPARAADFRALSDEEVRTLVTPRLRAGETVVHEAFRGPLGPKPDDVLVVVERGGNAAGFVVVPGGTPERMDLPSLSQGLLDSVPAMLFVDVDGQPGKEAIIMTRQMTGAGPQGAVPRAFNQVISWTGSAFVRLSDVEEALLDLETAAEIRKALAARAKKPT